MLAPQPRISRDIPAPAIRVSHRQLELRRSHIVRHHHRTRRIVGIERDGDIVVVRQRPRVEIEEGHWATSLAHLGNIVARTGRAIRFDPKTETVTADAGANRCVKRDYRQHWSTPKGV